MRKRLTGIIGLILFLPFGQLLARQDTLATVASDTAAVDSVKNRMIRGIGELRAGPDSSALSATRFLWTDVRTIADLLRFQSGAFVRDLGVAGSPDQILIGGIDARGLSFLLDGRPLRNPVTGGSNIHDIPLEHIDHIQHLAAPRGLSAAENSSAAAWNIVSRHYSTGRPITKIRFMQGPNEHLLTDAMYTQNITRSINILAGLQRHVSDDRFVNTAYDSWNVRSRIRFDLSDRLNFSLSDMYHSSSQGMNNGIDIDSTQRLGLDEFNNAEAVPYSTTAAVSRTRRDVTFTVAARVLPDSLSRTIVMVYYSDAQREYNPGLTPVGSFDRYSFEIHGALLRQFVVVGPFEARMEGNIERRLAGLGSLGTRDTRARSISGELSFNGLVVQPSVFFRGERVGSGEGFSWGAAVRGSLGGALDMSADYGENTRFPSLQELNWHLYRFGAVPNLLESHKTAGIALGFDLSAVTIGARYTHRTISNALMFRIPSPASSFSDVFIDVIPDQSIRQLSGTLTLRFMPFTATGGLTWTETTEGTVMTSTHPRIMLTGELAYEDVLLDGALGMRISVISRFVGRHAAGRYFPAGELIAEAGGKTLKPFSTFDLLGVFHVGDAYVSVAWENPLDREFMTAFPYPAMGRNVRVGVNWIFLD